MSSPSGIRRPSVLNVCKDTILPSICSCIPDRVFAALTAANPLCAYYHIVSDEDVPHVRHLYRFRSVKEFTSDLDELCRRFRVISLHELLNHVRSARPVPRNSLLLTFDDGFREVIDVIAPILRKKGAPATFFIIADCLDNKGMAHHNRISLLVEHLGRMKSRTLEKQVREILSGSSAGPESLESLMVAIDYRRRDLVDAIAELLNYDVDEYLSTRKPYLTSEQVRQLIGQGFSIGGHSIDHPRYSLLTLQEQVRQTLQSVESVRRQFALDYGAFAFPHGDDSVSDQFFEILRADGRVDVTFGTAGIIKDRRARHFQRFSTENSGKPVDHVLAWYQARSLFKMLTAASTHP